MDTNSHVNMGLPGERRAEVGSAAVGEQAIAK